MTVISSDMVVSYRKSRLVKSGKTKDFELLYTLCEYINLTKTFLIKDRKIQFARLISNFAQYLNTREVFMTFESYLFAISSKDP
jgi:hypothetical protein